MEEVTATTTINHLKNIPRPCQKITNIPKFSFQPNKSSTDNNKTRIEKDSSKSCPATGRERLKRHREEVAGNVSIPETWGKESLLKDWIDYSSFDLLLNPAGISSARDALIATSQRLRIEGRC